MLSEKLRELAELLRKEAQAGRGARAFPRSHVALPGPLPNPLASRATGNLGSLAPKAAPRPKAPRPKAPQPKAPESSGG